MAVRRLSSTAIRHQIIARTVGCADLGAAAPRGLSRTGLGFAESCTAMMEPLWSDVIARTCWRVVVRAGGFGLSAFHGACRPPVLVCPVTNGGQRRHCGTVGGDSSSPAASSLTVRSNEIEILHPYTDRADGYQDRHCRSVPESGPGYLRGLLEMEFLDTWDTGQKGEHRSRRCIGRAIHSELLMPWHRIACPSCGGDFGT